MSDIAGWVNYHRAVDYCRDQGKDMMPMATSSFYGSLNTADYPKVFFQMCIRDRFALFVGHVDQDGRSWPFEVWVNGPEQPRGLGAVAKTLSMDMRANDHGLSLIHI